MQCRLHRRPIASVESLPRCRRQHFGWDFWTGGRVYGYRIEKEENPPDPEHPRSLLIIDEREAAIVRRVFDEYVSGRGFATIAAELNRDGVAAPYDSTVKKKCGRGWGAGTIRAMLLNERYVGSFVWNKRKFVRGPGQRHRRAGARPRSEWRVLEQPELAIVSAELWERVQKRIQRRRSRPFGTKNRATENRRSAHLLTGVARCGVCAHGDRRGGAADGEGRALHHTTAAATRSARMSSPSARGS